jgi:CIC family chloride channel protein
VIGGQLGPGQGLGILGGGYGAAQVAITGAAWFPSGWRGVELFVLLGGVKMVSTALTVGSGGSAGDFGPSMVMGGIFGGAFGRAAQLLLPGAGIDPGAFALVGMGTFYGGLAHVPIGSLVMTCELAGSYDLLVPLMLAEGIAFVALRDKALYHAQLPTKRESPAHRDEMILDVLKRHKVGDVVVRGRSHLSFQRETPAAEVIQAVARAEGQDAFPVRDPAGGVVGVIYADILRTTSSDPDVSGIALAIDMMSPAVHVREDDDLHDALERMLSENTREVLVLDERGHVVALLDQAQITAVYLAATRSGIGGDADPP